SREWLTPHDLAGQTKLLTNATHLVLEQGAQRLDERELQIVRQPTHVVVALDVRGTGTAAGFDHVRIQRALHQELDALAVRAGIGAAATAESTPPDGPHTARLPPTCDRIDATCSSMMFASVQVGRAPAMS